MVLILQFLVLGFAFLWITCLLEAVRRGTRWAALHRFSEGRFKGRPDQHRLAALLSYGFLWCTILTATLSHTLVPHRMGMVERVVFDIHLPCALVLVVLMPVMMFWKNGMKDPRSHRKLGKIALLLSAVVLVTGIMLAAKL